MARDAERRLAYRDSRQGINRDDEIWVMDADGSHAANLTRTSANEWPPSWSPDGSRLAFSLLSAGPVQIGVIDRDGDGEPTLTPITENSELPAWSPDGSQIAFCRGFEGHRAIWIMRADATDAHRLASAGSDDVGPTWSPDGHFIAFSRRGQLTIMRSDGTDSWPVGVRGGLPAWTAGPSGYAK